MDEPDPWALFFLGIGVGVVLTLVLVCGVWVMA